MARWGAVIVLTLIIALASLAGGPSPAAVAAWTPPPTKTPAPTKTPWPTSPPWSYRQTQTAEAHGAGTPTPTAPPAATATATPTPPTGWHPVSINGGATFKRNVVEGLDLMRAASPAHYQVVTTYVTEIREGERDYSWSGLTVIEIAEGGHESDTYSGSAVLHEAVHVKNWHTNNLPVYGCDGEAKSLRVQADYLYVVGDDALAQWIEGLIGVHGC